MACSLNKEQVLDLYEVLYGEVIDRINDSNLPPLSLATLVQEAYAVVKDATEDQVKAMFYAQAIPDVFHLVTQDSEVNDYLVDSDFDFKELAKMRKSFADLAEVGKVIATPKKSADEIKSEIKNVNKGKKDFVPDLDVDTEVLWSYNENNGAKVTSAWTTSLQFAYSMNPEEVSEEDRNKIDPDKKLFSDVIKAIVQQAKERVGTEDITYNGERISLTAQLSSNVPVELLTQDDQEFLKKNPNYKGIISVITDPAGNFLYFRNDGTITDNPQEGRIVYQYLRKVNLVDGKLLLSNRGNRHYNLVNPEVIAQRQKNAIEQESNGKVKVTKQQFENLVKAIRDRQDKEMNDLYQLRQLIETSEQPLQIVLPIVGGTFGIPTTAVKAMTLEEAKISETDVKNYVPITTGANKGKQFIIVQKTRPGGLTVDQQIFLQRGDISKELAEKIADVLTTTADFKGRQLTPKERKAYFEIFINNALEKKSNTTRDGIRVEVKTINNEQVLNVEIKGVSIKSDVLNTPEGREMIVNQLLNARPKKVKKGAEEGSNGYWPADVSYNNS